MPSRYVLIYQQTYWNNRKAKSKEQNACIIGANLSKICLKGNTAIYNGKGQGNPSQIFVSYFHSDEKDQYSLIEQSAHSYIIS